MSRIHWTTMADVLREHRRSWPSQTAVACGESRFTYPELDDRVTRLANALSARGVGKGDRLLWIGQNCHRVLELILGAGKIGAMVCPANWRQSADELAFVVND